MAARTNSDCDTELCLTTGSRRPNNVGPKIRIEKSLNGTIVADAFADAGGLRSLPAWKQEVRDEEGRRHSHGAFTGGYSAGYYNTVGYKERWSPQTFTSSRKSKAEIKKKQNIYNFLNEEDIKDMGGQALETSLKFDTFGFTAAELTRKQAQRKPQIAGGRLSTDRALLSSSLPGTVL